MRAKQGSEKAKAMAWHLVLALLLPPVLHGCRLTDHTEGDPNEVTVDAIRFPGSGYRDVGEEELPRIEFSYTHIDLGRIVQGTKVDSIYHFKNTGGAPLVITDVRGSCGCTVGKDWPKAPVPPGGTATIRIGFDSEGRNGRQDKTVTVVANTVPPSTVLTLTTEVVGPNTVP